MIRFENSLRFEKFLSRFLDFFFSSIRGKFDDNFFNKHFENFCSNLFSEIFFVGRRFSWAQVNNYFSEISLWSNKVNFYCFVRQRIQFQPEFFLKGNKEIDDWISWISLSKRFSRAFLMSNLNYQSKEILFLRTQNFYFHSFLISNNFNKTSKFFVNFWKGLFRKSKTFTRRGKSQLMILVIIINLFSRIF